MTQWDGRGLPPLAAARVARAQASGVRTSLLSAAGAASLQSVGLDPVGEVMGCIVENVGWQGYTGCGLAVGFGSTFAAGPSVTVGTRESRWAAFRPYADAMRRGYATAMSRLLQEATALGADGVVGIDLTVTGLDGAREFMALGTAVRARSRVRTTKPFTTNLPGSEVAKLMQGGFVPVSLVVSLEVAIRHDDWRTISQAGGWRNAEVTGYTELTQHTRDAVRDDVRRQVSKLGADGFVASSIGLRVEEVEPAENHRDHVAEALLIGTALAQFGPGSAPRRLPGYERVSGATRSTSILPLAPLDPTRRNRP